METAIGLRLLVSAYRTRTGLWVNGLRSRAARRWSIRLAVLLAALVFGSLALAQTWGWWAVPLVGGVVAFVAVVVMGRRLDEAMRADLRTGAPVGVQVQP